MPRQIIAYRGPQLLARNVVLSAINHRPNLNDAFGNFITAVNKRELSAALSRHLKLLTKSQLLERILHAKTSGAESLNIS